MACLLLRRIGPRAPCMANPYLVADKMKEENELLIQ